MKKILAGLFAMISFWANAQEPIIWKKEKKQLSATEWELSFSAQVTPTWHLYSTSLPEDGPLPTLFNFTPGAYRLEGAIRESEPIAAWDPVFEMQSKFFDHTATFTQTIVITDPQLSSIQGEIEYQACDDKVCIFRTEPFVFNFSEEPLSSNLVEVSASDLNKAEKLKIEFVENDFATALTENKPEKNRNWNLFLLGFLGGLLALLTPCVFPMIPLTVSFFLKQGTDAKKGVINALLYAFFIVLIYVSLSLPFHFVEGLNPDILNSLSTNVGLNVLFFIIFVFFAFSFFGFYEINLPVSWGNTTDEGSNKKGILGIFFMALTLAIISFSCTGPILGSLLVGSLSSSSGAMQLSIGMTGFGAALALPFGLFALFPNALNSLPKSGGWMTQVKVVLGFLELALALKFLSNADLVAHWGILKREVFMGIWTLISFLLTLYLFGVIRFPHETKSSLSRGRIFTASIALLFTSFLTVSFIAKENTLKVLSGFPPPLFYSIHASASDCPLGLACYKDYETGRKVAEEQGKPILLDFTGWACVNCRKVEENVWSRPDIFALLNEEVILISLYVDDRTTLAEADQFNYPFSDGRIRAINTVGEKWATFQAVNFQTASQPYYVLMEADGTLLNSAIQYTDADTYYTWLKTGLSRKKPSFALQR